MIRSEGQIFCNTEQGIAVGAVVLWLHLVKQNSVMLNTILDLIPKPAVCGQEIQCRKQGIIAAVHVPADLQEHGAVCVVSK